uniref:Radical SAM domain protein n=1 Tax=uncultured crenarchaeote MCG TaxID=529375 RepID=B2YI67_9CREN|nr:radical SAM domain protein [uncultured crenarchaeote MCG]
MTEASGQRKVVARSVAIVLTLICVILAAGLIGVFAFYYSAGGSPAEIAAIKAENENLKSNMTSLNNQLSSLNNIVMQLNAQLANKDSEYNELSDSIADLNAAYQSLLNVVYLNASASILSNRELQIDAGANTTITSDFYIDYAGYFRVQVSSSSNTTYAQVLNSFSGFIFDNSVVVGQSGTAAFPVLPGDVVINIGNTEVTTAVNATVTVVYIY